MEELNHGLPTTRGENVHGDASGNGTAKADGNENVDMKDGINGEEEIDEAGIHERLERAFLITDVQSQMKGIQTSGSTVAVCLVEREMIQIQEGHDSGSTSSATEPTSTSAMRVKIHAANVGDARAVLSCIPDSFTCTPPLHDDADASASPSSENPQSSNPQKCYRLTKDHKASSPSEISRIENAGGFLLRNRVLGIMAVARSLGDHGMKEFVIGRPFCQTVELDLKEYEMNQGDEFVILACDGLWDTIEDEEAIAMVREYVGVNGAANDNSDGEDCMEVDRDLLRDKAAKMLCGEALKRGTTDNVTVLVAWL